MKISCIACLVSVLLLITSPVEAITILWNSTDSDDFDDGNDVGTFIFEFEIEGGDEDVAVKIITKRNQPPSLVGLTYEIEDPNGSAVLRGFSWGDLESSAEFEANGEVIIQEGDSERFLVRIDYDPEISGHYRTKLLSVAVRNVADNSVYLHVPTQGFGSLARTNLIYLNSIPVPEPSAAVLLIFGGLTLCGRRRN